MRKLNSKRALWIISLLLLTMLMGGLTAIFAITNHIDRYTSDYIYPDTSQTYAQFAEKDRTFQAGMILGAKVYAGGIMSDMLSDRVKTALNFYEQGLFDVFLISGDHGRVDYDEVNTVKEYLLAQGVPAEDIFLDHAGFDTYDSVYRAKEIFEVETVLIFSQEFHLPRAIYLCRYMDMECVGIISDRQQYIAIQKNERREILAKMKAFADVLIGSDPVYMGTTIPITGDSRESWD